MRVKIHGAGSIGNHLANASRRLGWSVDLVDIDPDALERTRGSIYPSRYGSWDPAIALHTAAAAPRDGHDLICIGTPPDVHLPLALAALQERPKALLIEKPLCGPGLEDCQRLADQAAAAGVAVFVGYDHAVGRAAGLALEQAGAIGALTTLDVEFREYWGGIFAAHPWLAGPWDSYLGYWRRGGGASGEHSHAANLWQSFAHALGAGRVVQVQASLDIVADGRVDYDRLCLMNLVTESGLQGRCVQDVVTDPPRKWARLQGTDGFVEWVCGFEPGVDAVRARIPGGVSIEQRVAKTRPDDFIAELRHIESALAGDPAASPIALVRGLETMLVVAAAHLSHSSGRRVAIDYTRGWSPAALNPI